MAEVEPLEYGTQRPRKWVTIGSFADSGMANVAKIQLDAEEIPNYLDNEFVATTLSYIQPAVGGIRLKVPEEFEEEAREILQSYEPADGEGAEDYDDAADGQISYAKVTRCPKCHSTDTEPLSWGLRMAQALVILMLGAMVHPFALAIAAGLIIWFILKKPSHRCLRCRSRFNAVA